MRVSPAISVALGVSVLAIILMTVFIGPLLSAGGLGANDLMGFLGLTH